MDRHRGHLSLEPKESYGRWVQYKTWTPGCKNAQKKRGQNRTGRVTNLAGGSQRTHGYLARVLLACPRWAPRGGGHPRGVPARRARERC